MINASDLARMLNDRGVRIKKIRKGVIAHNDSAAVFVSVSKGEARCVLVVNGAVMDKLATFVLNEVAKLRSNKFLADMISHYMTSEPYEILSL